MASKNIKGITIQFDADTTSLGRALDKVNKEAKGIDASLRSVNKALKFNPKNTELIAQKQTLLKQKIEQSKKQLEAFKAAEKTMRANGVDEQSQEFMELRRNIIETESRIKHFSGELEKLRRIRFEQVGQSIQDVGNKMQGVGKGMMKYVTAPIVAVGAAATKSFNEVKDGLNIVAQKTGATGKELRKMQKSARNLAKTIPTDFESAGTAIGEVNTRFGLTGKILEDVSGQYIKFAKVNDVDLTNSIDQTQKALSAFGKTAKDAPALLDALTKAGQESGASVDTLAAGLIQNAAAFQQLGLGMDQSVKLMSQLEKSGANSETVMQGLRKALKNAAKDGIPLDKALADLQKTIKDGKGDMDGLTAAYDLFGKSGDQIFNAVKNGSIDFSQLGQAATNSKNALNATFTETLTPSEKFQTTMNTLKDTGYQLGNSLLTILTPAIEKVAAGAQKVSEWWESLDKDSQDMIIKVGLVVAAIGPLLIVIGKITTGVGAIIKILPLLASPAGIAVAAIGGIIAAGVLLVKNWDKIKAAMTKLGDWLKSKWTGLKDFIKGIIDKIKGFFSFEWKLPKIPMPHFKIDPPGWKLRDLLSGEIPHLGIDWYDKGGIFRRPSVIGVGEKRPEFVGALDDLRQIVRDEAGGEINVSVTVNPSAGMDERQLAKEVARQVETILTNEQKRKQAAHGYI